MQDGMYDLASLLKDEIVEIFFVLGLCGGEGNLVNRRAKDKGYPCLQYKL